jgi:nucleotidyltransferase substrate binding protein (TIGR01987 family)
MLYLNVEHLERCRQTLRSSLELYKNASAQSIEQEVFRNAIVKGYELTQETAYKLIKKALKEFGHGSKTLESTPVKDLIRLAAQHGLISIDAVERWFAYRDNRNHTAHDYGEGFAQQTLLLIPGFLDDIERLSHVLSEKFGKDANG